MTTIRSRAEINIITTLEETKSFRIDNADYLLGTAVTENLLPDSACDVDGPVILIHQETVRTYGLKATLDCWSERDDVYNKQFNSHVLVIGSRPQHGVVGGSAQVLYLSPIDIGLRPQEGPYYVRDRRLYPVWRVYEDTQKAFILPLHPESNSKARFVPLRHLNYDGHRVVAVSSRIPSLRTDNAPLSGLRISVKDNIDLNGVHTGLSSRAWRHFYPPKQVTSPLIAKLMDTGAVVVGKTILSQFGVLEYPMTEWIDVHPPTNPRGDGNLSPAGSTSGGAAALAAYSWLDASIGTDTAGSIRKPAAHNGLFALRPTTPDRPIEGIFPLASNLDAPGFLARDMDTLIEVAKTVLPEIEPPKALHPGHIYVIDTDFEKLERDQGLCDRKPKAADVIAEDLMVNLVRDLLNHTQAEASCDDLQTMFKDDLLPEVKRIERMFDEGHNPTQQELLHAMGAPDQENLIQQINREQAVETIKHYEITKRLTAFVNEYKQACGRKPYLNPVIRHTLRKGQDISEDLYAEALELMRRFRAWFAKRLENSIAVFQLSHSTPEFRDEYVKAPWEDEHNSRIPNSFISPLAGCPEVVIPIDQIPYQSDTSGTEEQIPLVVSIIGPPGSDLALLHFVRDFLEKSGRPLFVKTGKLAFDDIPVMRKMGSWGWRNLAPSVMSQGSDEPSVDVVSDVEQEISDDDGVFTDEVSSVDDDFGDLDLDSVHFEKMLGKEQE